MYEKGYLQFFEGSRINRGNLETYTAKENSSQSC